MSELDDAIKPMLISEEVISDVIDLPGISGSTVNRLNFPEEIISINSDSTTTTNYRTSNGTSTTNTNTNNDDIHDISGVGEDEYEIESIVDHRFHRGVKEYRIRWKGWDASYDTWEPDCSMKNCADMILEYSDKRKKVKEAREKLDSQTPLDNTGFNRNKTPESILGISDDYGDLCFLVKWKGCQIADIVTADDVYSKCPQLVLKMIADRLEKNAPPIQKETEIESKKEAEDITMRVTEESPCKESIQDSDIDNAPSPKNAIIKGVHYNEKGKPIYVMREKHKPENGAFLVPIKTAHSKYLKAVFLFFEKNLMKGFAPDDDDTEEVSS